ncbi:hypothetical protein NK718_15445 [Alsobacter sp. SYSU M60028]|uniref:Uncharacterized protein n=1 Tax=Alsobacter ponti TaxID=2962936 RepID=A0ABT1LGS4_9HYPH|nr:hypothetical protein [Alsobacter ponti]MCP8939920.1 hypothetical protein [Alsobacter ponti]
MALVDLADWMDEFDRPQRAIWYVKRLAANDTLANERASGRTIYSEKFRVPNSASDRYRFRMPIISWYGRSITTATAGYNVCLYASCQPNCLGEEKSLFNGSDNELRRDSGSITRDP